MATSTQGKNGAPTIEVAYEQVKDLNEQFLAATRKAGHVYLDSYEKAVDRAIELELKVAGLTQQEWLRNLIETQAEIAREVTSSYTSTARSLLK
ncbi:MAG: hypothetical protein JO156_08335 [Solirubrobacterales bacterium]|nr:hypothetical protein [Solirubrobacterales bacterium]